MCIFLKKLIALFYKIKNHNLYHNFFISLKDYLTLQCKFFHESQKLMKNTLNGSKMTKIDLHQNIVKSILKMLHF